MKILNLCIVITLSLGVKSQIVQQDCRRPCGVDRRVCTYYFVVDKLWTMTPDCLNCTNGNEAHCDGYLCLPGDGRRRMCRGINGQIPGPPIEVCQYDIVIVRVKNLLSPETLSIHWHGMHQKDSPHMDGVPMVTQRPIQPDEEFIYKFNATEPGTHFYHSHSGIQRADGVYGHLIVKENEDPPITCAHDRSDHVISLLDWFHSTAEEIQFGYMRTKDFYADYPKSILVNGRGHTPTNRVPPRMFNVTAGTHYRFRIIHAGNIVCPVEFSIDNHDLIVFNSDGHHFSPVTVQSLTLTNGERFDFVLNTTQPTGQYVMRFEGSLICNVTGYAILNYEKANSSAIIYDRTRQFTSRLNCVDPRETGCISYNELKYIGNINLNCSHPAPVQYFIGFDHYNTPTERFDGVRGNELYTPFMNNITFEPPTDVLLCNRTYRPTCENKTQLTKCTHLVSFEYDTCVDIFLTDIGQPLTLLHPMHLHGYSFAVVGHKKFGETANPDAVKKNPRPLYSNNTRPIFKDTVAVPDGGTTIIRMRTNNPGSWLLHCHVDFHSERGMQMVIETGKNLSGCIKQPNCDCLC